MNIINLHKPGYYVPRVGDTIEAKNKQKICLEFSDWALKDNFFENCDKIEEVYIPSSVDKVGKDCFKGCKNLRKIILDKETDLSEAGIPDNCEIVIIDSKLCEYDKLLIRNFITETWEAHKEWVKDEEEYNTLKPYIKFIVRGRGIEFPELDEMWGAARAKHNAKLEGQRIQEYHENFETETKPKILKYMKDPEKKQFRSDFKSLCEIVFNTYFKSKRQVPICVTNKLFIAKVNDLPNYIKGFMFWKFGNNGTNINSVLERFALYSTGECHYYDREDLEIRRRNAATLQFYDFEDLRYLYDDYEDAFIDKLDNDFDRFLDTLRVADSYWKGLFDYFPYICVDTSYLIARKQKDKTYCPDKALCSEYVEKGEAPKQQQKKEVNKEPKSSDSKVKKENTEPAKKSNTETEKPVRFSKQDLETVNISIDGFEPFKREKLKYGGNHLRTTPVLFAIPVAAELMKRRIKNNSDAKPILLTTKQFKGNEYEYYINIDKARVRAVSNINSRAYILLIDIYLKLMRDFNATEEFTLTDNYKFSFLFDELKQKYFKDRNDIVRDITDIFSLLTFIKISIKEKHGDYVIKDIPLLAECRYSQTLEEFQFEFPKELVYEYFYLNQQIISLTETFRYQDKRSISRIHLIILLEMSQLKGKMSNFYKKVWNALNSYLRLITPKAKKGKLSDKANQQICSKLIEELKKLDENYYFEFCMFSDVYKGDKETLNIDDEDVLAKIEKIGIHNLYFSHQINEDRNAITADEDDDSEW